MRLPCLLPRSVGETCELKTALPTNVIRGGPFGYIKAKIEVLLPDAQIVEIVEAIKTGMCPKNFLGLSTRETKLEHLASLKDRHSSTTTCPKCGGELILRTIKKGEKSGQQFYGCGKYPACRYMRPIAGYAASSTHILM